MPHDWPEIPDTPEQRALIAEHNARARAKYPRLVPMDTVVRAETDMFEFGVTAADLAAEGHRAANVAAGLALAAVFVLGACFGIALGVFLL